MVTVVALISRNERTGDGILHDAQEQDHDQDHSQPTSAQDGVGRNIDVCIPDRDKK
jgi:hypothetical protein